MRNFILQSLIIFLIGIVGGVFGAQILWPLFVERPLFYQYRLTQAPTYVTETKQVFVQENSALQDAVEKTQKTVIAVRSKDAAGRIRKGSGLALTTDGLIVTLNELLPQGGEFVFLAAGSEEPVRYQILKRDPASNLVLVKLEINGLSVADFADPAEIRLGERVFLVSALAEPAAKDKFTRQLTLNEGIISFLGQEQVGTTMIGNLSSRGAPVFNIAGSVVGLSQIAADGSVNVVLSSTLRSFTGL